MVSIIRQANLEDREAIYQLHLKSWQTNYGNELSQNILETKVPDEMAAKWAKRTLRWPEIILVAESGPETKKIVGFVCALADREVPLIDNLHVLSEVQSRGVGAKLLGAVLTKLAMSGFETATLEVLESNERARRFYTSMGGEDIGRFWFDFMGKKVPERHFRFKTTN